MLFATINSFVLFLFFLIARTPAASVSSDSSIMQHVVVMGPEYAIAHNGEPEERQRSRTNISKSVQ